MTTTATVRPLGAEDLEGVLDLCLARDLDQDGEPNTTREEIAADLGSPDMHTAGIDGPDGDLLGYAWAEYVDGHETVWCDLIARPGAEAAVGTALFAWLRSQAAAAAPGIPLWIFADSGSTAKIELIEAAGGRAIRRFYRMAIDFAATPRPPVPELAPGVEIRGISASEDDLRTVHRIADVSFADHFGHEPMSFEFWRRYVPDGGCSDLSLYWIATVDGEPAATLYSTALPTHGHIDTLGTLREFRGRGLARALLLTAFEEFERRGTTRITLGVDATNPTGALGLYESVGMAVDRQGDRYELGSLA